jgi:hypothetical protein
MSRIALAVVCAMLGSAGGAAAQGPAAVPVPAGLQEPTAAQASPADGMRVYLMTVGQGTYIWEKFGHNAIWIRDEARGIDIAYNWGVFDFDEPGFIGRLIRGRMMYRIERFNGQALANAYVRDNRSIWLQELNLTTAQKTELFEFTEWNAREENKYYRYDYYRDNCSTRVRDALDRALGGALRAAFEGKATGTTYRQHTERLTAETLPEYTGLLLALGPSTDRPIDAWEESFLPVKLMEHVRGIQVPGDDGVMRPLVLSDAQVFEATRTAERTAAPGRGVVYGAIGVALALLLIGLSQLSESRAGLAAFGLVAFAWSFVVGTAGVLIAGLWAFSEHAITYGNENVLQSNVLSFVLAGMLLLVVFGRALRPARAVAAVVAVLSVLGFVMQVLPMFDQVNGTMLALTVPAHTGLAVALYRVGARRLAKAGARA